MPIEENGLHIQVSYLQVIGSIQIWQLFQLHPPWSAEISCFIEEAYSNNEFPCKDIIYSLLYSILINLSFFGLWCNSKNLMSPTKLT